MYQAKIAAFAAFIDNNTLQYFWNAPLDYHDHAITT